MTVAGKLLKAIDAHMRADQGASFRRELRKTIPFAEDAFREEDGIRGHLGASILGHKCSRALWYGFRWVGRPLADARMLRLWNRGHLEEARFIALLRMLPGVRVWTHDAQGKQFRVDIVGSHAGGSCDGASLGIPDCPTVTVLNEFKTHKDSLFTDLVRKGVKEAKPEHYVQMMQYMPRLGLSAGLYLAVNKDTDALHAELVAFDQQNHDAYTSRAVYIVNSREPPPRISNNPTWYECKFCDFRDVCHSGVAVARNCRTCAHVTVAPDGWQCGRGVVAGAIPKSTQLTGCDSYEPLPILTHAKT